MKRIFILSAMVLALFATAAIAQRKGHFDITKTDAGKYYFVLRSSNGQEILKGYQFASAEKVQDAIAQAKAQAAADANFDQRNEKNQFYFFLKGADGKAIARSENYTTEAAMKRGIDSIKRTAPDAEIKQP
jgi:uncharacterized protein YegP (UPF0339 family)